MGLICSNFNMLFSIVELVLGTVKTGHNDKGLILSAIITGSAPFYKFLGTTSNVKS